MVPGNSLKVIQTYITHVSFYACVRSQQWGGTAIWVTDFVQGTDFQSISTVKDQLKNRGYDLGEALFNKDI